MGRLFAVMMAACVGMTAFVAWGRAAFPSLARAAEGAAGGRAARAFWVGLAAAAASLLLFIALVKGAELFKPLAGGAILLAAGVGLLVFRGALAVWPGLGAQVLGEEAAPSPLKATMTGGAVLAGSLFLVPAGFFLVAWALALSLGTGLLQLAAGQTTTA
ncbi:MAG: hypothetical protein KGL53_07270 [Elusimicrobia bacterium]|nr:hypothetical protein [Elusimicrobiota bacterium]